MTPYLLITFMVISCSLMTVVHIKSENDKEKNVFKTVTIEIDDSFFQEKSQSPVINSLNVPVKSNKIDSVLPVNYTKVTNVIEKKESDTKNSQLVARRSTDETLNLIKKNNMPEWVLPGILKKETKSSYSKNGSIIYRDRRVGLAGEIGPFQMKEMTFNHIKKNGEKFSRLTKDMEFAEELATRYLIYLYNGPAKKNWKVAVSMYNIGPGNYREREKMQQAKEYLSDVIAYGKKSFNPFFNYVSV